MFKRLIKASKRAVAYDMLFRNTRYFWTIGKKSWDDYQSVKQPTAMQPGLSLTEEEIKQYRGGCQKALFAFCVMTFLVLIYLIHSLAVGEYALSVLIFSFLFLCGAYIFKFHFLLFQLKHPDHFVTPKEWWDYVLRRKQP